MKTSEQWVDHELPQVLNSRSRATKLVQAIQQDTISSLSAKLSDEEIKRISNNLAETIVITHSCLSGEVTKPLAFAIKQAILEALSLVRGGDGWQPIESAPRDGSLMLLTTAGDKHPGIGWFEFTNGQWCVNEGFRCYPTHWMPLTPPPVIDAAMKKE